LQFKNFGCIYAGGRPSQIQGAATEEKQTIPRKPSTTCFFITLNILTLFISKLNYMKIFPQVVKYPIFHPTERVVVFLIKNINNQHKSSHTANSSKPEAKVLG
jgi:hypothetical protein